MTDTDDLNNNAFVTIQLGVILQMKYILREREKRNNNADKQKHIFKQSTTGELRKESEWSAELRPYWISFNWKSVKSENYVFVSVMFTHGKYNI